MSWSRGLLPALLVVALACQGKDSAPARGETKVGYAQGGQGAVDATMSSAPPSPEIAPTAGMSARVAVSRSDVPTDPASASQTTLPDQSTVSTSDAGQGAMIIRTGTAVIKVDSLEPAVARLRALALSVGGYVGNTSMQTGSDQLRSATVEIKVPAARWGLLLTGLRPIGTLEAQDESAQDVGEEFVDVQARVANARRLEARLIDLLANRTGKLSDALSVERELARVREEIDRYEGRMRYLKTRAAISTMTVTVHEPAPVLGSRPGDSPIGDALRNAWRLFVGLVAFLIASLGVVIPLAIVAWLVWTFGRRRRTPPPPRS